MLIRILITSCLLVASMTSHATLISYNGYTRTAGSNIVTGGGLEWLKWDATVNMSVQQALSVYGSEGWTLASNEQMADIFNIFKFGKNDWSGHPSPNPQWHGYGWTNDENSPHNAFMSLFGATYTASDYCYANFCIKNNPSDKHAWVRALYGVGYNSSAQHSLAIISDDGSYSDCHRTGVRCVQHFLSHDAKLYSDADSVNHIIRTTGTVGVALVRSVNQVPQPASICLIALSLVVLGYRRRQALGR